MIHCPKVSGAVTGRVNPLCDFSHCCCVRTLFILVTGQWRKDDEYVDSNRFNISSGHIGRDI